jgi:hypothetical protein
MVSFVPDQLRNAPCDHDVSAKLREQRPRFAPEPMARLPPVARQTQNSIAVLAVMAAIALLAVTLVVPRKSLLLIETPAAYADAS